jgi:hypothetical protein
VSARSVLTKGLDRVAFVLILSKSADRHRSRARSAQAKLILRVANLSRVL